MRRNILIFIFLILILFQFCKKNDVYVIADFDFVVMKDSVKYDTLYVNDSTYFIKPVGIYVDFTNNSQGGLDFEWNFGDNDTVNKWEDSPLHLYKLGGEISATLTVTGNFDIKKMTKLISLPNIKPNFEIVELSKDSLFIKNISEFYYGMSKYTIDWGDGEISTDTVLYKNQIISHKYRGSGIFDIKYTIERQTKQFVFQKSISISDFMTDFIITLDSLNEKYITDNTQNNFGNELVYIDWGDGEQDTAIAINSVNNYCHKYKNGGNFRITYRVKRGNDEGIAIKTISLPGLSADFTPKSVNNIFTYKFEGTNIEESFGDVGYHWDFGDGEDTDTIEKEHTFKNGGIHNVTLTLTRNGESSSITKSILIPALRVNFDYKTTSKVDSIVFIDLSFNVDTFDTNSVVRVMWDFGDGENYEYSTDTTRIKKNISHEYDRGGIYMTTYQISQGTEIKYITKAVNVPVMNASIGYKDCARVKKFTIDHDNIISANIIWDFGDGTQISYSVPQDHSLDDTITHYYSGDVGTKIVRLTIQQGSDVLNVTRSVNVFEPYFVDDSVCNIAPMYLTCRDVSFYDCVPSWEVVTSKTYSVEMQNQDALKVLLNDQGVYVVSLTYDYAGHSSDVYSKTFNLLPLNSDFSLVDSTEYGTDSVRVKFMLDEIKPNNYGTGENQTTNIWYINDILQEQDTLIFEHIFYENDIIKIERFYNGISCLTTKTVSKDFFGDWVIN